MKKRVLSAFLAGVMLISSVIGFAGCTDKELESYTGELYCEIQPIKNGAKGIITIVHDDGVLDTVEFMSNQFRLYKNLTASLALITDRVISSDGVEHKDAEKWKKLVKNGGFDIVGHTQTHTWYGIGDDGESGVYEHRDNGPTPYDFEPGHMTNEIAGSADRLAEVFKDSYQKVLCFAIPGFPTIGAQYNGRSDTAKMIIEERFIAARSSGGKGIFKTVGDDGKETETVIPSLNNLDELNYQELNSWSITINDDPETDWYGYVDNAINYGGWGIFLFHAMVKEETDYLYSVSRSKASKLFAYINEKANAGDLWCATFTEAAQYTREAKQAAAEISVSGKGISVTVTDNLDNYLYDAPLSVKVQVMNSWETAEVKHAGEKYELPVLTDTDGSKYVMLNIAPDTGAAIINKA